MKTLYTNIVDLQGAGFAIGRTQTLKGWKAQAREWATMDEHIGIVKALKTIKDKELIKFICDYWDLMIVKTDTLKKAELLNLCESEPTGTTRAEIIKHLIKHN